MVEFDMDCSHTEQGWFELKSFLTNGKSQNLIRKISIQSEDNSFNKTIWFTGQGWENDLHQTTCQGTSGGAAPFLSINHVAKCGSVNKFDFQSGTCEINEFPTTETPTPSKETRVFFSSFYIFNNFILCMDLDWNSLCQRNFSRSCSVKRIFYISRIDW